MSENLYLRRVGEEYNTIYEQCERLNIELQKLVPLAKQMHLLSSNAVASAARAGSKGDAFRVLTQDIQLLGDDVSASIQATPTVMAEIVMLAANLAQLFTHYLLLDDLHTRAENNKKVTSDGFLNHVQQRIVEDIKDNNHELSRGLNSLSNELSPIAIVVKKGEYLSVCSSVEAASAGEHGVSFEAVASMLRELVGQLGKQSARQRSLLRDLSESMEKQQQTHQHLIYTR
ncbi:hypothetical protein LCGC14_0580340 [marine sediment metagenome]|uniref:Methyl-accepting transducer domain-containing protein n=1 Tax=marine sediment metagenome TaxID=412755 RepID=A0A0F9RGI4_9ZZZZ|nr:hypothetical protein [Methylophaga sp.]HEC60226.1 hypothetical protein [Methylophaga sp.]